MTRSQLLRPFPWEANTADVWAVYVKNAGARRAFRRGSYATEAIALARAAVLRATYAGVADVTAVTVRRARPLK